MVVGLVFDLYVPRKNLVDACQNESGRPDNWPAGGHGKPDMWSRGQSEGLSG